MPAPPSIFELIEALAERVNAAVSERLAERGFPGIRAAHGKVFEHLQGGVSVSALAARCGVTKQSMAELVRGLERSGYVARERAPDDARVWVVRITPRGTAAMAVAYMIGEELRAEWADAVGGPPLQELERGLGRLAARWKT